MKLKLLILHFFTIFFCKDLHISKKSSTFAPAFEKRAAWWS